ncbi:MAG: GyrI-like domain-containing protein [Patescibacteria group bacterium]
MKPGEPEIIKLPLRTVLTLAVVGDPNRVTAGVMQALYGTAFGTKFSGGAGSGSAGKAKRKDFDIGRLSAFWPDAMKKPKSKWTAHWMLDVPSFVRQKDLLQKNPNMPVKVKTLPAATVAEILHIGPYSAEGPTIKKLNRFIALEGYRITGPHEEVYLSRPGPKGKTIIRYRIKQKRR